MIDLIKGIAQAFAFMTVERTGHMHGATVKA